MEWSGVEPSIAKRSGVEWSFCDIPKRMRRANRAKTPPLANVPEKEEQLLLFTLIC